MLTAEVEQDRMKCFGYWPASVKRKLDDGKIRIECLGVSVLQNYVATRVQITDLQTRNVHEVRHVRYKDWPEHGVPALTQNFVAFLSNVNKIVQSSSDKILVHCSSGAGRSGVFVTTFLAQATFSELETWDFEELKAVTSDSLNDVFSTADVVQTLRQFRCPFIVRTKAQYMFCFRVIADMLQAMAEGPVDESIILVRGQSDIDFRGGFLGLDPDDEMRGLCSKVDRKVPGIVHNSNSDNSSVPKENVGNIANGAAQAKFSNEVGSITSLETADKERSRTTDVPDTQNVSDAVGTRRHNREERRRKVQALKEQTQKRRTEQKEQVEKSHQQQPSTEALQGGDVACALDSTCGEPASDVPEAALPLTIDLAGKMQPPSDEEGTLERLIRLTKRLAFGGPEPEPEPEPAPEPTPEPPPEAEVCNTDLIGTEEDVPLREGWAKKLDPTSQRVFYANMITKETTWIDPRAPTSNAIPDDFKFVDWNELPVGWERVVNAVGDLYYANHNNSTTSWFPPRDIRQAEHVDILQAVAMKAYMQLKHTQGATDTILRSKMTRHDALVMLQQQVKDMQVLASASDILADDRLRVEGQIELLQRQVAAEASLLDALDTSIRKIGPDLAQFANIIRAIEEVSKEFSSQVSGAAQMNRSRKLSEKQVMLANELRELQNVCVVDLSRLTDRWQKVCAANGSNEMVLDAANNVLYATPTGRQSSDAILLHVGIDGNLKTDCAMKVTALVVEFILLKEVRDLREEVSTTVAKLEAAFAPQPSGSADAGGVTNPPHEVAAIITPEELQKFATRLEHACTIPCAFMSCVERLLGNPPGIPDAE